jgi:hypothetical protein
MEDAHTVAGPTTGNNPGLAPRDSPSLDMRVCGSADRTARTVPNPAGSAARPRLPPGSCGDGSASPRVGVPGSRRPGAGFPFGPALCRIAHGLNLRRGPCGTCIAGDRLRVPPALQPVAKGSTGTGSHAAVECGLGAAPSRSLTLRGIGRPTGRRPHGAVVRASEGHAAGSTRPGQMSRWQSANPRSARDRPVMFGRAAHVARLVQPGCSSGVLPRGAHARRSASGSVKGAGWPPDHCADDRWPPVLRAVYRLAIRPDRTPACSCSRCGIGCPGAAWASRLGSIEPPGIRRGRGRGADAFQARAPATAKPGFG